jgi:alkylation response protein AidB-like acyl-CoA dehydrogenase
MLERYPGRARRQVQILYWKLHRHCLILPPKEEMMSTQAENFESTIQTLAETFGAQAAAHDQSGDFIAGNFELLRQHKVFSACVPADLGGGGVSHRQMSDALRVLGSHCGATALALSMHQHLLAAQLWNYRQGRPVKPLLEAIAQKQIAMVSTGANDWLQSNGTMTRVDGGYTFNARKPFASGAPFGNLLMTSGPYQHPQEGWQVLHFGLPMNSKGLRIDNDWNTLGMRGTGSHTVILEDVFVPEDSVKLTRPRDGFHPMFSVISVVALPYIMSAYVGVAEAAAKIAREQARNRAYDPVTPYLLGEMENHLAAAQMARDSAEDLVNEYDFKPAIEHANAALIRKTIAANAVIATVDKAMEVAGGAAFFKKLGLERLLRDVRGAQYHPMQEKRQHLFTGRVAMGLDPVKD